MKNDSAVQFATNRRIHMALAVKDLAASVEFYRTLFGQEPSKCGRDMRSLKSLNRR